jgi:hypothetical protein
MSETLKLHEVVAIRKGVKSRTYGELTELHKENQKPALFNGLTKEFKPKDADGETFPDESQRVQRVAEDILRKASKLRTEALDIEATQEYGNLQARADVVIDGRVILQDMPATLLIHLEKELSDLRAFVAEMPTLDEAKSWAKDANSSLYRSDTAVTHKTKKVSRPIVKYDAVIKDGQALPAQTEMITEDVVIGHWHTTYLSGGLPVPRKEELLERIDRLRDAVKRARARANDTEVTRREIGGAVFSFLLG